MGHGSLRGSAALVGPSGTAGHRVCGTLATSLACHVVCLQSHLARHAVCLPVDKRWRACLPDVRGFCLMLPDCAVLAHVAAVRNAATRLALGRHRFNHVGCSSGYNLGAFRDLDSINSQAAEQSNSELKRIRSVLYTHRQPARMPKMRTHSITAAGRSRI